MTYPRAQLVPPGEPGFYHCISRCVRRAFLCGDDALTGRNFDHRKDWIRDRILVLADCFAVSVYAYAVMSNHFHIVVHVDPGASREWSAREVARRWLRAFPGALQGAGDPGQYERCVQALAGNPERLSAVRARLGSLSWFMRAVNEPIARQANREDDCTGRFWEGRFKCQALLDERAMLACMAYVDLNPLRAGLCTRPEASPFTSVRQRLEERTKSGNRSGGGHNRILEPVAGLAGEDFLGMTEESYLDLVQWTARQKQPHKHDPATMHDGMDAPPPGLWAVAKHPLEWLYQVQGIEAHYYRAVGNPEALLIKAHDMRQRWMKGISSAVRVESLRQLAG